MAKESSNGVLAIVIIAIIAVVIYAIIIKDNNYVLIPTTNRQSEIQSQQEERGENPPVE